MELQDLVCKIVPKNTAKSFISKYHYSHTCPNVILAVGEYYNDKLINCIVFNYCVGRMMCQEVMEGGDNTNTIELARMVSLEPKPKNLETYSIAKALRVLKQQMPNIKICISYADNEMGHHGYCYQAAGFEYYGNSRTTEQCYIDGERVHSRTIFARYGTNSHEELKRLIGKDEQGNDRFIIKEGESKNRYYIILPCSKTERKNIKKLIKVKSLPYPKGDNKRYDMDMMTDFATLDNSEPKPIEDTPVFEPISLF